MRFCILFVFLTYGVIFSQEPLDEPSIPTGLIVTSSWSDTAHNDLVMLGGEELCGNAPAYTLQIPKTFRFQARRTGEIKSLGTYIHGYRGDRTDDAVIMCVYNDTMRSDGYYWPGSIKCFAYEPHYNWTILGTGLTHKFNIDSVMEGQNAIVVQGEYYWITMWNDSEDNIEIERSRAAYCITWRAGINNDNTPVTVDALQGRNHDIQFGSGDSSCYGWSVWGYAW
jgi:hypothetical protein